MYQRVLTSLTPPTYFHIVADSVIIPIVSTVENHSGSSNLVIFIVWLRLSPIPFPTATKRIFTINI